jgi:nucleoside-diphosphate-sugar epimerase
MKNVLVTGGTGFIGLEVIRRLNETGITPRVLVRRPHRASLLNAYDIEPFQGDLTLPETLQRALRDVDTVFHLGGRASFESYRRLKPTIVDGTLELGRRSAAAGVEHFVFASSLFVYGNQTRPIDAESPIEPVMGYGRAKLEAELGLERIAGDAGMTLACLRLPHVYGPQSLLYRQVRSGIAVFPGGMDNTTGQLHVDDAAAVMVAAGRQRWVGRSAVADATPVTWDEYFQILEAHYPHFRLITLPYALGYAGGALLEPILSRRNRPTLFTKDTVVGFNLEVPVAPGLVWDDLGLEPRYRGADTGIPATLDGYVRFRWRSPLLDHRRC